MPAAAKRAQILDHRPVVGRHEHHGVGPAGQRLADQRLLLADIVGRRREHSARCGPGLGGHPVGGQPGRDIGGLIRFLVKTASVKGRAMVAKARSGGLFFLPVDHEACGDDGF